VKKITYMKFGSPEVLEKLETDIPEPSTGQVLVKVEAAGINPVDYKIRNGSLKLIMPGRFPRTPGGEIAGIVDKIGPGSSAFKPGSRVFAMLRTPQGGYAQYVAVPEKLLCLIPQGLSFEEAAAIPLAGLTALQSLRDKGRIKKGMRVLVNGASGGVGSYAVQIANAYQAQVTGVCSGRNARFVQDLGADVVIDYEKKDFINTGNRYDIILDAVANKNFTSCRKILKPGGVYISTLPYPGLLFRQALNFLFSKKAYAIICKSRAGDLAFLGRLVDEGKLKSRIEKHYSFDEVILAHQRIESGRVRGKLVLTPFSR
jgi:NADPH:quinone reductase-like Zn-dependent oxidoreductase